MPTHKTNLSVLSVHQLSLITGKAYNTVKRLLAGVEPVRKDGRTLFYSTPAALAAIYREKAESERERLDRVRADKVDFDLAVARGAYVAAEGVRIALNEAMRIIASNEDAIAGRLAQKLVNMTSAGSIRKLLLTELRRGRDTAASRIESYAKAAR